MDQNVDDRLSSSTVEYQTLSTDKKFYGIRIGTINTGTRQVWCKLRVIVQITVNGEEQTWLLPGGTFLYFYPCFV